MNEKELIALLNGMSDEASRLMPTIEGLAEYALDNETPGLDAMIADVMTYMAWVRQSVVGLANASG